jgi:hypothetical protein
MWFDARHFRPGTAVAQTFLSVPIVSTEVKPSFPAFDRAAAYFVALFFSSERTTDLALGLLGVLV